MSKGKIHHKFYCPYGESLQTLDVIWKAKENAIKDLKAKGYTDDQINHIMTGCL